MARFPKVERTFVNFDGGMDTETPPLRLESGFCYDAQNFECDINGGYSRLEGYERYDGRTSPSDAQYYTISANITGNVSDGDTMTGNTSNATGVVVNVTSNQIVMTKVTGNWANGEDIIIANVAEAATTSTAVLGGASSAKLDAQYYNFAADNYRADINAVPGVGDVLGVWVYDANVYAFRNNNASTEANMFKATTSGWTQITFYYTAYFNAGTGTAIAENDVLTQSNNTATVYKIVVNSGDFTTNNAAGWMLISENNAFSATTITSNGGGSVNLTAGPTQITLNPGGRYEFVNENFGGSDNNTKMYGCDGANPAFEFDGTYFQQIHTGMTTDTPSHIAAHRNHLFLSFAGSVQHSSIGAPLVWDPVTGAAELAMGDTVNGFMVQPGSESGGAMMIATQTQIAMLYGTSSADWSLIPYSDRLGAYPYTIQRMAVTLFLDNIGVTMLEAAQTYGNFADAALSDRVRTFVQTERSRTVGSCLIRDKNQYRLFFSDGYVLIATITNGQLRGMMPGLFDHLPTCATDGIDSNGNPISFFGCDDGYVYQMEKGTSFDGNAIDAHVYIAYNFPSGQRIRNRFRHATFEIRGLGYSEFDFSYDIDYATTLISQEYARTKEASLTAVNWDSFVWDNFVWDGITLTPSEAEMRGTGENVSLKISTSGDYFWPIRFSGVTLHYTPRRLMR